MASKTQSKTEIVDFLWSWAEKNGDWAKLLVSLVVRNGRELNTSERDVIFNEFLRTIGLFDGESHEIPEKPTYTPTNKKICLSSLSKVLGVNRLAKDQTITFSPNLTVIYGENGTGKTGYGRILKALGFSYDPHSAIYSNIFGSDEEQTATIEYTIDGAANSFIWDGKNSNADLQHLSVFNTKCVDVSLSDKRTLIVSPIGFHLFDLISTELQELEKMLDSRKNSLQLDIGWIDSIGGNTPQRVFLDELNHSSSDAVLASISVFDDSHEQRLCAAEKELSDLNAALISIRITNTIQQISELDQVIGRIEAIDRAVNGENWKSLCDIDKEVKKLESTSLIGIADLAKTNNIKLFDSTEFTNFLRSAEAYIKKLGDDDYPSSNEGAKCIYCKQSLGHSARDLVTKYRELLNDTTEARKADLEKRRKAILDSVRAVENLPEFSHVSFGADDNGRPVQPEVYVEYKKGLLEHKANHLADKIDSELTFDLDSTECLSVLKAKKDELEEQKAELEETRKTVDQKVESLNKKIAELKARKLLFQKLDDVRSIHSRHKEAKILEDSRSKFNTAAISRKTSDARKILVEESFDSIFASELKKFRKSHISVELNFTTTKGKNTLSQKLGNYELQEILSEGEQKAIALAEFLTELQLESNVAPVVFDDPVNSIDHKIIDEVARRLLDLSKSRQVIILTHSVLLFNSLLYLSGTPEFKKPVTATFLNTSLNFGETGVISDAEELSSVTSLIKKINMMLDSGKSSGLGEATLAANCYASLRAAIELAVEHEILRGTVKRYQKNVALTNFAKIDAEKLKQHRDELNEIFERCCGFIEAHSNPETLKNDPDLDGFEADFDAFKRIRNAFVKN